MDKLKPGDKPKEVDNVVITCMDFRYQETIRQILQETHGIDIDNVDRLSIGGSSKGVTDGTFTESLQIANEKHSARNVFLFDHIDCGGFGGLAAFDGDEQKEARAHFEEQDRAVQVINKVLPEFVVVTYVIGMDGEPVER